MTFLADRDGVKQRIARAEAVRDAWQTAGRQADYLASCTAVDALKAELEVLERSARDDAAQERRTMPGDAPGDPSPTADELMAKLNIVFDGRSFHYGAYRYHRLSDAVNYAELDHRGPSPDEPAVRQIGEPTAAEQELMRARAITFDNGVFRWHGYQYDRLSDALAYSSLEPPAE